MPNEDSAIAASRHFATKPHLAGSPQDLVTAVDFLHILQKELGITPPDEEPIFKAGSPESKDLVLSISEAKEPRAWIDTYYPILNTPLERHVQILGDDGKPAVELDLVERVADDTDGDARKYADAVPTFHGLSRGGDVTGPLIHGGYCTKPVSCSKCTSIRKADCVVRKLTALLMLESTSMDPSCCVHMATTSAASR